MSSKKITLNSSDGESIEVDEEVAMESPTIKRMIEDDCIENGIPLPVTGKILSKVIEYCEEHVKAGKKTDDSPSNVEEDLKAFDTEFIKVDEGTLYDLVLAANFFNIKGLLDLSCQTVKEIIMNTTAEEIIKSLDERLREPAGV